jgi:hypothetical protein
MSLRDEKMDRIQALLDGNLPGTVPVPHSVETLADLVDAMPVEVLAFVRAARYEVHDLVVYGRTQPLAERM